MVLITDIYGKGHITGDSGRMEKETAKLIQRVTAFSSNTSELQHVVEKNRLIVTA